AAAEEALLRRGQHDTLDRVLLGLDAVDGGREVVDEAGVHRVGAVVGIIHGEGDEAVAVLLPPEHVVAHWFSTPVWLWCRWAGSDALDDGGDAHAAADAERDEGALAAGALEFVEDRAGDHRAGRAERMAH